MSFPVKQVVSTLLVLLVTVSFLYAQRITFEPYDTRDWDKIKARQKEINRCAFFYVYSDNSTACQMMNAQTLSDEDVSQYINGHFVNVRVNMDSTYGIAFAKKYQVNCYPAYLIFDPDGHYLIQRRAGFLSVKDMLAFCESHKDSYDHTNKYIGFQENYDTPNPGTSDALNYLKVLSENCFATNDTAVAFLLTQKQPDFILPDNWQIINHYVTDVASAPFNYVVNNRKDFVAKYSLDTVNNKLFDCYLNRGRTLIFTEKADQNKFKVYRTDVGKVAFERSEELGLMLDFMFAEAQENWKAYFTTATDLVKKYKGDDPDFLSQVSHLLLEKSNDKKQLASALVWAKKSTELKPDWQNLDTYAQLMFKTGDKTHAVENERKAIDLAKAAYVDTIRLSATLKSFNQPK